MAGAAQSREEELVARGWTKQFRTDEPRLSEAVEMYKEMGLEVRLEPVVFDPNSEECQKCFEQEPERYKIIWTRPQGESQLDEDLF
jgi:hypothetical protein